MTARKKPLKLTALSVTHNPSQTFFCKFCAGHPDTPCAEQTISHHRLYFCTREKGHRGKHVACGLGSNDHPMHEWSAPGRNWQGFNDKEQ